MSDISYSVKHLFVNDSLRPLDARLAEMAGNDGDEASLSLTDVYAAYEKHPEYFDALDGLCGDRVLLMWERSQHYLAARYLEYLNDASVEADPDLFTFAMSVHVRGDYLKTLDRPLAVTALRRNVQTQLLAWISRTNDVPALVGLLNRDDPSGAELLLDIGVIESAAAQRLTMLTDDQSQAIMRQLLDVSPNEYWPMKDLRKAQYVAGTYHRDLDHPVLSFPAQRVVIEALGAGQAPESLAAIFRKHQYHVQHREIESAAIRTTSALAMSRIVSAHPEAALAHMVGRIEQGTDPWGAIYHWTMENYFAYRGESFGDTAGLVRQALGLVTRALARWDGANGDVPHILLTGLGLLGHDTVLRTLGTFLNDRTLEPFHGDIFDAMRDTVEQLQRQGRAPADLYFFEQTLMAQLTSYLDMLYASPPIADTMTQAYQVNQQPRVYQGMVARSERHLNRLGTEQLVHLLRAMDGSLAAPALLTVIAADRHEAVRTAAVRALGGTQQHTVAVETCLTGIATNHRESIDTRIAAIEALGELNASHLVDRLQPFLAVPRLREATLRTFFAFHTKEAVHAVEATFPEFTMAERQLAYQFLNSWYQLDACHQSVLTSARQLVTDQSIKHHLDDLSVTLPTDYASDPLVAMYHRDRLLDTALPEAERIAAAVVVSAIGDDSGIQGLIHCAEATDQLAVAAIQLLGHATNPMATEGLQQLAKRGIRIETVLKALGQRREPGAIATVRDMATAQEFPFDVRLAAIGALDARASMAPTPSEIAETIDALRQLDIGDEPTPIRRAAHRAIAAYRVTAEDLPAVVRQQIDPYAAAEDHNMVATPRVAAARVVELGQCVLPSPTQRRQFVSGDIAPMPADSPNGTSIAPGPPVATDPTPQPPQTKPSLPEMALQMFTTPNGVEFATKISDADLHNPEVYQQFAESVAQRIQTSGDALLRPLQRAPHHFDGVLHVALPQIEPNMELGSGQLEMLLQHDYHELTLNLQHDVPPLLAQSPAVASLHVARMCTEDADQDRPAESGQMTLSLIFSPTGAKNPVCAPRKNGAGAAAFPRWPYPHNHAKTLEQLVTQWRSLHEKHCAVFRLRTEGTRMTIEVTPNSGESFDAWTAMWRDLALRIRNVPAQPALQGALVVQMQLPTWPSEKETQAHHQRFQHAMQAAFSGVHVDWQLQITTADPNQLWMPDSKDAYRIPSGLTLIPLSEMASGKDHKDGLDVAILRDTVDEMLHRLTPMARLDQHELVLFVEAPQAKHDEDSPRALNEYFAMFWGQAIKLFAEEHVAPTATAQRADMLQRLARIPKTAAWIRLGSSNTWRIFPVLVPKHLRHHLDNPTQMQAWADAVRQYQR